MEEDGVENACGYQGLVRLLERRNVVMRTFQYVFDAGWICEYLEDVFGRPTLLHGERALTRLDVYARISCVTSPNMYS